jgi:hypothetical protein
MRLDIFLIVFNIVIVLCCVGMVLLAILGSQYVLLLWLFYYAGLGVLINKAFRRYL